MEDKKVSGKKDDTVMLVLATFPLIGLIIYFAMSDASPVVKHYARQSSGLLGVYLLATVLSFVPVLGWILSCLLSLVALVAWVLLLVNALQGNATFKLPVLGDLIEKVLK